MSTELPLPLGVFLNDEPTQSKLTYVVEIEMEQICSSTQLRDPSKTGMESVFPAAYNQVTVTIDGERSGFLTFIGSPEDASRDFRNVGEYAREHLVGELHRTVQNILTEL